MEKRSTRRAFLTTAGVVGVASLAGCSNMPGGSGETPASPGTTDTQTTDTTKTTDGGGGEGGTNAPGKSVDAFEDVSQWDIGFGKLTTTKQDVFEGKQSFVLEPKKNAKKNVVKIGRRFPVGKELDLSSHDLSLAAKVKKPKNENRRLKVRAQIIAPAESSSTLSIRQIPRELDDWVRFDLGYVEKTGNPEMKNVAGINIQIGPRPDNKPFQVVVDDLRKVPKAKKGKVMLQFDDGHVSAHQNAFPILKEKGWPGTAAVTPDVVGVDNYMGEPMLRELAKNDWNIVGHGSGTLPELSSKRQKRALQETKRYLDLKGFKDGAKHYVVPRHRVNKATLKHIDELFETAYLQGGCPNNAKNPSNSSFISRVNGVDVRNVREIIDMAAEFNQLAVVYFHRIGDYDQGIPTNTFKKVVDHVASKKVDVITPSQLIGGK